MDADLAFDISPDMLEKLQGLGLNIDENADADADGFDPNTPIDFEKLGIDISEFQATLEQAIQSGMQNGMKMQMKRWQGGIIGEDIPDNGIDDDESYLSNPIHITFYSILLLMCFFVFKPKSIIPSLIIFVILFILCGCSDYINLFLHESNIITIQGYNPFDAAGIFMILNFLQPMVVVMIICSIRWVLSCLVYLYYRYTQKPTVTNSNTTESINKHSKIQSQTN